MMKKYIFIHTYDHVMLFVFLSDDKACKAHFAFIYHQRMGKTFKCPLDP